jgi:hypothetical protein
VRVAAEPVAPVRVAVEPVAPLRIAAPITPEEQKRRDITRADFQQQLQNDPLFIIKALQYIEAAIKSQKNNLENAQKTPSRAGQVEAIKADIARKEGDLVVLKELDKFIAVPQQALRTIQKSLERLAMDLKTVLQSPPTGGARRSRRASRKGRRSSRRH